jgi:signal transduction histidine kinase
MGLLTADRRSLEMRLAVDGDVLPDPRPIPLGDDPLSIVATSGRSELAGTRSGNDHRDWLPGYTVDEASHSQLTVPITVGRNVIGALSIQSTFRNAYGPRDKDLLTAVALHTGIAIENARLYRLVQSRGDRRAAVLDQVMTQQEIERKELVDDIHDDTLQTLAACLYRLDQARSAVEKLNGDDPALVQISDVRESLSENIARLRQRIFAIRPATLDRLGLESALRELLTQMRRDSDLTIDVEVDLPSRLTPEAESLAYRLIQEALTHVRGLERVSSIQVNVEWNGDCAVITIVDDGTHTDVGPRNGGQPQDVALMALMERADLAGGHVRVARRAAGGSLIHITVPAGLRQSPTALLTHPIGALTDGAGIGQRRTESGAGAGAGGGRGAGR